MRSLALLGAAAVVTAAGLAGCGRTNAVSGLNASQAVQQAAAHFNTQSLRFDLDGTVSFDASKLQGDAQIQDQLKALASGLRIQGSGEEENPQRVQLTLSITPPLSKPVTVVSYDGTAYAALDGTHFADAGSLKSLTGGFGITPGDINTYLSNLGNVQDKGAERIDNVDAEHYQVALDQGFLQKALGEASQGQSPGQTPNPFAGIIEQLVQFTGGAIDVWVNQADGTLDRTKVAFGLSFNLDKLGQLFGGLAQGSGSAAGATSSATPTGSVAIALALDLHAHDYGSAVKITKPTVDPDAPKLPSGLNLFGQGS